MKYFLLVVLPLCLFIYACSSGDDSAAASLYVTPRPGTQNYLKAVQVDGNILQPEHRFLSYTKKAQRVSIIDPDLAQETWSRSADNFEFAIQLPDFQGASLFASDKIVVMSGNAQREFPVNESYVHVATSKNQAAYSLSRADGKSFELVRSMGNGQWQTTEFTVPWGTLDPTVSGPIDGQPFLLVTQFNHDGTMLVAISPSDGRYAVYTAESIDTAIQATVDWCPGDNIGTPQNASFYTLAWDEARQLFFAGDKNGNVYAIDPKAACPTATTVITFAMPDSFPIFDIALFNNGDLGILQYGNTNQHRQSVVSFSNGLFSLSGTPITISCERPVSSIATGDPANTKTQHIVVMCDQSTSVSSDTSNANNNLLFSDNIPYQYFVYDYNSRTQVNTFSIDKNNTVGLAIDTSSNTLFRMLEGAFGTLESFNLLNGTSTVTKGLYIRDLLN